MEASEDVLIDIFVRIEGFFKRLESYTEVPPTDAMTDAIVKIMTEVFSILGIATKEIKQSRSSECGWHAYIGLYLHSLGKIVKKLLGKNDIEDALKRLDTLTMEEARMAIAETLKVTNRVDNKVDKVDDKVTVLIDGEQIVFSHYLCFLNMDVARREGSKRAVCEHRRRREAFVLSSHCR